MAVWGLSVLSHISRVIYLSICIVLYQIVQCANADCILKQLRNGFKRKTWFSVSLSLPKHARFRNEASRFVYAIICVLRELSMTLGVCASMIEILLCVVVQSSTYI